MQEHTMYGAGKTKKQLCQIEAYDVPDSALMSCIESEDSLVNQTVNQMKISELQAEIEIINEDRERLNRENEELKKLVRELPMKKVQIELLSKIATRSLEHICPCKSIQSFLSTPSKVIRQNIRIASPSDCFYQKNPMHQTNGFLKINRTEFNTSPLIQHRYTSSKVRVSRNAIKSPRN